MKISKTHVACALALATLSGQVLAQAAPGNCDPATGGPYAIDIYLTGASAPQNALVGIMDQLLEPGYTVVFDRGVAGATAGNSYRAYCGTLNSTTGSLSGKKIRFLYRAKGGSVWGVNAVARDQRIARLSFASADCVSPGPTGSNFGCNEVGDDLTPANPNNRQPDFGVSDVEPTQFKGPLNVEFGQTALTPAEAAKFTGTQRRVNGVIFGLGLTQNLISAGVTNLTKAQVVALLTGSYQDWNQVNPAVPAGTHVTVCRRVPGSGTQATFNNYFLNFPCSVGNIAASGSRAPLAMSESAAIGDFVPGSGDGSSEGSPIFVDPTQGVTIVENPSSGDLRNCLSNANAGVDWNFRGGDSKFYRVLFSRPAATLGGKHAAIGLLSLDSIRQTNYGTNWSFVALNGLTPVSDIANNDLAGLENAIKGAYDLVSEVSIQWKNDKTFGPGVHADYAAFINQFVAKAGQASILAGLGNNPRSGTIALPGVGTNVPATLPLSGSVSNPTAHWTRLGNSCNPPIL